MINYEQELNEEQLAVVKNGDGPCLVLAGAGSGKTRTITYRVAYLIEHGVDPSHILLVTFTNKAAKEMIARVKALTAGEVVLPWSGTFHHIGYRILRRYAPLIGYKNNFTILDSEDSLDLLKLCLKQEGIDRKERRFPSPKVLQSIISFARNAEKTIEDVLDLKHPQWMELSEKIGRIMADYRERKQQANAMDFDDLLVRTYELLLKHESVRRRYSQEFQYVLVDEYQDTNTIQASLVRMFASHHRNLLVVGDDAQSIYSFRAADIQNILAFEQQFAQAKVFRLETNYRSTPNILDVANEVIANNVKQYKKELKSVREMFTKPEVHAFADQTEEAEFIAGRILELRDEGVALNHIAVLFRAAFHSQALEMELAKRDIPYDYRGGVRFFERAHVKDVLAYLRVFHNRDDVVAWSRVLNMQVGIGPSAAERIIAAVKDIPTEELPVTGVESGEEETSASIVSAPVDVSHIGALLPARGQVGWNDFLQIWERMLRCGREATSADLIQAVLDSKYRDYLENEYPDYRERLQDLEQLALFAERDSNVHSFLANASLQESYVAGQVRGASDDEEKIVLSTIHQAKGLEWEVVFIVNVSAGQFPSERSMKEDAGIEEERRLFYVAVTRAKKQLYMTYPLMGGFESFLQGPSMFLDEIDRNLLDTHSLSGGTSFTDPSDDVDDISYVSEDGEGTSGQPFGSGEFRAKQRPKSFLKEIEDLGF